MRRTAPSLLLGLALGVAVIASACSKQEEAAKPMSAFAVSVARVQARDIPRSVLVSGPVSAWEEMQLGVELSGLRVTSLLVDVGQRFAAALAEPGGFLLWPGVQPLFLALAGFAAKFGEQRRRVDLQRVAGTVDGAGPVAAGDTTVTSGSARICAAMACH